MSTFTYDPQTANRTVKPRVYAASFGDGYEQRIANGINNAPRTWVLSWVRQAAEADAILAFFIAQGAATAFTWVDPDGVSGRWVCREWSNSAVGGTRAKQINATFEEVFGA